MTTQILTFSQIMIPEDSPQGKVFTRVDKLLVRGVPSNIILLTPPWKGKHIESKYHFIRDIVSQRNTTVTIENKVVY
jgi:hypothetical protein